MTVVTKEFNEFEVHQNIFWCVRNRGLSSYSTTFEVELHDG